MVRACKGRLYRMHIFWHKLFSLSCNIMLASATTSEYTRTRFQLGHHPKLPPESFPILRVCIKQSLDREEIVPWPPHPTKRISIYRWSCADTRSKKKKRRKIKAGYDHNSSPNSSQASGSANQPRPNCTCVASTATNDQKKKRSTSSFGVKLWKIDITNPGW